MGDYVRVRRLEECRKDMLDFRHRAKTITEIAFGWGFSDAAHFSHAFRKQFGISPRAFRSYPRRGDDDFPGFLEQEIPHIQAQPN